MSEGEVGEEDSFASFEVQATEVTLYGHGHHQVRDHHTYSNTSKLVKFAGVGEFRSVPLGLPVVP